MTSNRSLALRLILCLTATAPALADPAPSSSTVWKVETPIVTYWCGPSMTDSTARQMTEGGFNLVWCNEPELDVAQRHGLRALLTDGLLTPATLDQPAQREKLDALIQRVSRHPALYAYFIVDEPSTAQFPALGKLVSYLRERDPAHLAYINLFPTYASNEQLGTKGDKVTAYRDHLRQYVDVVRPSLISYDHYQFTTNGDTADYFLNLAMIRRASLEANLPFLNIVQACSWTPSIRVPQPDEMRYLVNTTLAYGAQGISYYVYCCANHRGGIAKPDGSPTELFPTLSVLNREFVAIASELLGLTSVGVYHAGMLPPGAEPIPPKAAFTLDPQIAPAKFAAPEPVRGVLLGLFGPPAKPGKRQTATHAYVVNLDYKAGVEVGVRAAKRLEVFNPETKQWVRSKERRAGLYLLPGGGQLVRIKS